MNNLVVIILAAGKGTRMNSTLPKVCHDVSGKPMIQRVVETSLDLLPKDVIVVVSKENIKEIGNILEGYNVRFKIQYKQLGTAHAVLSSMPCCNDKSDLLVLLGDVPLINSETLIKTINTNYDAVIIGFRHNDPDSQFERVVIKNNRVNKIVEYSDATEDEKKLTICNSGMLWIKKEHIILLKCIDSDNKKDEYHLTDIIEIMVNLGMAIGILEATYEECMGVDTRDDLDRINKLY